MIQITIPFKTPTINHLYGQRGFRKFLKPEAVKLREKIKELTLEVIQGMIIDSEYKLTVVVEIYEDWYTKEGKIKKKDVGNREKFLVDSIFSAMQVDDKNIFKHTMIKKQSDKEFAVVTIK